MGISTRKHMASEKSLHYALLEELAAVSASKDGALDAAVQSLSAALGVGLEADAALSYRPQASLSQIFAAGVEALQVKTVGEEKAAMEADPLFLEYMKKITDKGFFKGLEEGSKAYLDRWAKAAGKFKEKQAAAKPAGAGGAAASVKPAAAATAAPVKEASDADKAKAEELKAEGNKAIQAKEFRKAEGFYTQALALVSHGQAAAVYHCNRAAARAFLNDDDSAKADAARAVELDPNYAKAHSRLGYACYQLGEYQQAVDAYKRALELDPKAAASKDFLEKAQAKLLKQQQRERDALPTADAGGASGFGGMPDLSSLAGMMGGGGGGAGGLGGLMNNPGFMQMAQSMMQNPEMMRRAQEMMSNPEMMAQAQSMLSGMGMGGMPGMGDMGDASDADAGGEGGGGGMTDLNDLMSRLGGAGGGGGNAV